MLNTLRALTCLLTGLLFATTAHALDVQEVTSPKGIKAWLVSSKTVPLIAINFSFDRGAVLDPKGREGAVQFITGMMDEGAGDLTGEQFQIARDDIGMKLGFNASLDRFEGNFQTPVRSEKQAVALLRKALNSPHFDSEAVERVRLQFLASLQQSDDDASEIAQRAVMKLAYGDQPYARPLNGNAQSLKALTVDDLKALHKQIFTRDGLKIGVSGDIDAKHLGLMLDEIFGDLPETTTAPKAQPEAISEKGTVKIINRDIPQSVVSFASKGILRDDPDYIPAFVMSQMLGGGDFGTTLMEEVRVKHGLTYGISYSLMPMKDAGLYLGSFNTRNEKVGEAIKVMRATLQGMAEKAPSQQDLDDAKTFLTGSFALRFDGNAKIADQLLNFQVANLPVGYINSRNEKIMAVTLEQVKAQAKRLLHPDQLLVVVVGKPEGVANSP